MFKFKSYKLIIIGLVIVISIIPVRLAITLSQVEKPQAILVLGGSLNRFREAAKFSESHAELDIWASIIPEELRPVSRIFALANIPSAKIHYDFCATDTVSNFTCLVDDFVSRNIYHVYLITSDYHMARAVAIATLVFGSRGIAVTAVSIPSTHPHESAIKVLRDFLRSLIWLVTGYSFG